MLEENGTSLPSYVEIVGLLNEENKPPGGAETIKATIEMTHLTSRDHVLDVGCSTGFSGTEFASRTGCRATGVDTSDIAIARACANARRRGLAHRASFVVGDALRLPFPDVVFDLVFCGGVLSWIADKEKALSECARVMNTSGVLVLVPLYYRSPPPPEILHGLMSEVGLAVEPWEKPFWLSLVEGAGLRVDDCRDCRPRVMADSDIVSHVDSIVAASGRAVPDQIRAKLIRCHRLFNNNHRYLDYSIIVCGSTLAG